MIISNKLITVDNAVRRLKAAAPCLLAIAVLLGSAKQGFADLLVGPTAGEFTSGGSDANFGVQFTANHNAYLTGFDFNQRAGVGGGTISVFDVTTGHTVFSTAYTSALAVDPFSVGVHLNGGDTYRLLATLSTNVIGLNNEMRALTLASTFGTAPNFPDASTPHGDITVTGGIFSSNAALDGSAWGAFSNLTTVSPEPGSLVLLCTGLASIGGFGWVKKWKSKVVAE